LRSNPNDVGDHLVELDVHILQRLLKSLDVTAFLANELFARAQQVAQNLVSASGTKLPRISPWARRSANQVASLTSVRADLQRRSRWNRGRPAAVRGLTAAIRALDCPK
jgi:hypothetical protein